MLIKGNLSDAGWYGVVLKKAPEHPGILMGFCCFPCAVIAEYHCPLFPVALCIAQVQVCFLTKTARIV